MQKKKKGIVTLLFLPKFPCERYLTVLGGSNILITRHRKSRLIEIRTKKKTTLLKLILLSLVAFPQFTAEPQPVDLVVFSQRCSDLVYKCCFFDSSFFL